MATPRPHLTLPLAGLATVACVLFGALMVAASPRPAAHPAAQGPATGSAPTPSRPVRVAVLVPFVADALAGLPAGRCELVASVARAGHTVAEGAIDLGSPHHPNFEVLARARPDLVIGDAALHGARRDQLGRTGAEVMLIRAESVGDTFAGLQRVGERLGAAADMEGRIAATEAELRDLRLRQPVQVLPLFGAPGSFLAITGSTWLGDLLNRLGFTNLASGAPGQEAFPGYLQLSDEVLTTLRPDRVLLVTHGKPEAVAEAFARQAEAGGPWARLAAKATVLDPEIFGDNPGLRIGEAARALVSLTRDTGSTASHEGAARHDAGLDVERGDA